MGSGGTDASTSRLDRRKARTRESLVGAAQALLAEGRASASIQEITELADVGFGTFYNHFTSKQELFEVAVDEAVESYGTFRDQVVSDVDDPAEVFAISLRMTGRLQRIAPDIVRIFLNSGTSILTSPHGLAGRARRDLQAGQDAGRFDVIDLDLAVVAVGGGLLGLFQHLDLHPELDDAILSDLFAERVLRMFGLTKEEAQDICARPLTTIPDTKAVHAR